MRPNQHARHHSRPLANALAAPHLNAGKQARLRGETLNAIACFREAIRLQPDCVPAYNNLATALQKEGRLDEAIAVLRQALALDPGRALLHNNLGGLLQQQGELEAAIAAYRQALALDPALSLAHLNLGKALIAREQWQEALDAFDVAHRQQPASVETLLQRGMALTKLKRYPEALSAYEQALALAPDSAPAYLHQSATLMALNAPSLAYLSAQQAIALDPHAPAAYYNRGLALSRMNRCREALSDNQRAIALQPDYADAHWNAALNHLLLGDYADGWNEYEWRWQRSGADPQHYAERPLWTGEQDLQGKTILLHAEQGMGDCIQFSRYAPLVAARGARVLLEVYPAVAPLFVRLPGVSQLLLRGPDDRAVDFDYHCPLLSLPRAFATRLERIPAQIPYLRAHPKRLADWRARLGARQRPRIGLAWSGNAAHQNDAERSIPLADLAVLIHPQFDYYSLQIEVRESDRAALDAQENLRSFGEHLRDFSDTAALIAELDLVISVDTAVAHLAGALGKPVWLLLAYHPDWRWMLERSDSPWYPSMRLFRQAMPGDWRGPLAAIRQQLWAAGAGLTTEDRP